MPVFALADCNSFYCSCERVFEPKGSWEGFAHAGGFSSRF